MMIPKAGMFALLTLEVLMAATPAAETLSYQGKALEPVPVHGLATVGFDISGPKALTEKLLASNVMLSVQKLQATTEGHRTVSASDGKTRTIQYLVDKAHVDGTFRNKSYQYDFVKASPPVDLQQDQLRQFSWAFSVGGRNFKLGTNGEYITGDDKDDAQGEAMGVIMDAPVRLPNHPVQAGEEWTAEWRGDRRAKDNGASFQYKQKGKIVQFTDAAPRRARIAFETTGRLDVPNPQTGETILESKGAIVLDLTSGVVVAQESSGTITTDVKSAGLKIIIKVDAKYEQK